MRPRLGMLRSSAYQIGVALDPRLYPAAKGVDLYWYDSKRNFGDLLNPWLFKRLGFAPFRSSFAMADLIAIGSVLDAVTPGSSAIVWGSGMMYEESRPKARLRYVGVRGHLTRAAIGRPAGEALGDPGLLVGQYVRRQKARWPVGIVPHFTHHQSVVGALHLRGRGDDPVVIDVARHPSKVVAQIAQCGAILSSSLHGLVVADSLGIPAAWMMPEPVLSGGEFKFRDYQSVLFEDAGERLVDFDDFLKGLRIPFGTPRPEVLQDVVRRLADSTVALRELLPQREATPAGLVVSRHLHPKSFG